MSLVEDRLIELNETEFVDASAAIETWRYLPASTISHHGESCCRIAREWFLLMDYAQLNAGNPLMGPRWIRQKFVWGPSQWPIHWCKAMQQKTLDCGALGALAHEIFINRGVRSYPVQLIQQYSLDATRQWYKRWNGDETSVHWIKEDLIYHEGCAVAVEGNEIKIWDASAGSWIDPKQFGGYGGLLAVRIFASHPPTSNKFSWGKHCILPNEWQKIERAKGDFM